MYSRDGTYMGFNAKQLTTTSVRYPGTGEERFYVRGKPTTFLLDDAEGNQGLLGHQCSLLAHTRTLHQQKNQLSFRWSCVLGPISSGDGDGHSHMTIYVGSTHSETLQSKCSTAAQHPLVKHNNRPTAHPPPHSSHIHICLSSTHNHKE